ncbi:SRPBCC family protein [Rhodococcus sp. IEGM 1379]|uniref:SRPBCC family protein n=1 Tax=Rhodococcus sp. IEGM 1379 TaxID=3047086 RepID=UPI0024B64AA1|nr:SRPBCC family protein [Rhodococcus sp. IEGM 1379]MDI9917410.1 SRPBCC family protein [Rhodococcus sp. IEGM 1379]
MSAQQYQPSGLSDVTVSVDGDDTVVTFPRTLPHPVDQVWAAVTDPEMLAQWSPYTADRDLSSVGEAVIIMLSEDGSPDMSLPVSVRVVEESRRLEHEWGPDELIWELTPVEGGTHVVLTQRSRAEGMASALAAGWHLCFDVLDALLAGSPFGPVVGAKAREYGWDDLNARYARQLGIGESEVW